MLAGFAGNWLITPARHPEASTWMYVWIWIQLLGGLGLLAHAIRAGRRTRDLKGSRSTPQVANR